MYARGVEEAALRLRELRREVWGDLGLAVGVMALALAAAEGHHTLAMPLFCGSVTVGGLGVRALWRRWELVDRLSGERDAFAISEVFDHAAREATLERRRDYAAMIRRSVRDRSPYDTRIAPVTDELERLACELEDGTLTLDPACAVACRRLLSDPADSALFDSTVPAEDLLAGIRRIRQGLDHVPGLGTDEADSPQAAQSDNGA
jgi:hypothetical protein